MNECPHHEETVIREQEIPEQGVQPPCPVASRTTVARELVRRDEQVLDLVVQTCKQLGSRASAPLSNSCASSK
jgi:hypothetical protein